MTNSVCRTVGIVIYENVEVLDFAGPFEVFSVARLEPGPVPGSERPYSVSLVAQSTEVVTAAGGMRVLPDITFDDRLKSFFQSIRMHYFAVAGALISWTLWPKKKQWLASWRFRAAVFVSALFAFLMGLHMWASLFNNYCVYCLNVYMAFFSLSGLLLVVLVSSSWSDIEPRLAFGRNLTLDNILRCDTGMVGTALPQRPAPLHAPVPDQNILQGIVQRMPHVQLPGHIGRWYHDTVGLTLNMHIRLEIALFHPDPVPFLFDTMRVISFC